MIVGRLNNLITHRQLIGSIFHVAMQLNYFLVSLFSSLFILRENLISDFNVFDIFLPFVCEYLGAGGKAVTRGFDNTEDSRALSAICLSLPFQALGGGKRKTLRIAAPKV